MGSVHMFWLAILLTLGVEGKQKEPSCAPAEHPPDNLDSCLSQPSTNVCSGEVQLQNVLEAGLDEKCKEEEETVMKKEETSGKKGEEMKTGKDEMKSGCLFLLETSTREVLTSREACALESAARNSGLNIFLVTFITIVISHHHHQPLLYHYHHPVKELCTRSIISWSVPIQ